MSTRLCRHFGLRRSSLPARTSRIIRLHATLSQPARVRREVSPAANAKIDFLALETKWQARRDNRGVDDLQDAAVPDHQPHSLSPFYLRHFKEPIAILETLEWHYRRNDARAENKACTVFDRIFKLSRPRSADFGAYIRKCGDDVVRTSLVFRDSTVENVDIDEAKTNRLSIGSDRSGKLSR